MAEVDFKKFYQELQDENFKSFYFLYGEEDYLIERSFHYLVDCLLPQEFRDFNFHVYYPEEVKEETVLDNYEMYPMMAPRRVLIFKEVGAFNDSQVAVIQEIIKKPNDMVYVVFLAPFIDKKKKIFKLLSEKAYSLEFKRPYDNQIPQWIQTLAKEQGVEIDSQASHGLHELIGSELRNLNKELLKLKDYVYPRTLISIDDVQKLIANSSQETTFKLVEQWIEGSESQRLKLCEEIIDQGESELGFLQLLARHLRILLQVKKGLAEGLSRDQLGKKFFIPTYFMDKYLKQSRQWSEVDLQRILAHMADVEMNFKRNPQLKKAILNDLVWTSVPVK